MLRSLALLAVLAGPAAAQTKNFSTPAYQLTGGDYKHESPAINQMFRNTFLETQYLQGQITAIPAPTNSVASSTVAVNTPLSGDGSSGSPVSLTGKIPINLLDFSTITTRFNSVGSSTQALSAGGATTYLRVDGSNGMVGQFTSASSATFRDAVGLSSAIVAGGDPGTYGYVLISSGAGHAPFWQAPVPYGFVYYLTATSSDISGFKVMSSTGQTSLSTTTVSSAVDGVIVSTFATNAGRPGTAVIPPGRYIVRAHFAQTGGTKVTYFYAQLWEYTSAGAAVAQIGTTGIAGPITGADTGFDSIYTAAVPYVLASTSSRIAIKIKLSISGGGSAPAIALYYGGADDAHLAFPASVASLANLVPYAGATQDTDLGAYRLAASSVTTTNTGTLGKLVLSNVASGTQCLHADGSGNVTGTGSDCGAGGGGGTSTQTVTWQIDNFLGQVNGSQKAFTLSQVPSSTQAIIVVLDGLLQSSASDYSYTSPYTITMTSAPASNSSSFFAQYTINTSTLPAAMLVNSTDTVSGTKNFTVAPQFLGLPLMVPLSSSTFSGVTTATVSLPSGYSGYFIRGHLQNANASARSAFMRVGGDTGSNYGWALINNYVASSEHLGCDPGGWFPLTDSTSNANRLSASSWVNPAIFIEVASSSVMTINATAAQNSNDISQANQIIVGGAYRGSTQTSLNFSMGTVASCTSNTVSATSISGTIYVYGMP